MLCLIQVFFSCPVKKNCKEYISNARFNSPFLKKLSGAIEAKCSEVPPSTRPFSRIYKTFFRKLALDGAFMHNDVKIMANFNIRQKREKS